MAQELKLDEGKDTIPILLQQLVFEANISIRLQALDTLLSAIDDDISKRMKVKIFKTWLRRKYLSRVDFVRQLKLYSKINENVETAIEYHGKDFLTHSEYIFDEEFENEVTELSKNINNFVGKLLKEYAKGEVIEFG